MTKYRPATWDAYPLRGNRQRSEDARSRAVPFLQAGSARSTDRTLVVLRHPDAADDPTDPDDAERLLVRWVWPTHSRTVWVPSPPVRSRTASACPPPTSPEAQNPPWRQEVCTPSRQKSQVLSQ